MCFRKTFQRNGKCCVPSTMLLLFLSLFIHFNLVNCVEFEKGNSNGPPRTKHEAARIHNCEDCSSADVMWNSTPGIDLTNWITPPNYFLPTTTDQETYIQSPAGPTPKGPYFTERFPRANRWNQKVTQRKIRSRQLKNNVFRYQPRHQQHQGIGVLEISKRRNPEFKPKASSYDSVNQSREPALSTGTKKRLFPNLLLSDGMAVKGDDTNIDGDDEFEKMITLMDAGEDIVRLREVPEITTTETSTATTVRQVLRQKADAHPYFRMIETLQEGYMMVFLIELTRLVATKERKAVRDVVKHTDQIINGLYQRGQLLWFGKPLINVARKVARLLKESEIDVIQNHAANLHHMLSQRRQELSVEVNTILEYADMLYDDDEGRLLFDALQEFAAYPDIRITGYWLCKTLINTFLKPFRRLRDTQERQELMDSVNMELKSYEKTSLRGGDVRQADDPPDEYQPSPQTEPVTQTEPYSVTTRSPRERKRKRHHRLHKRKRERKRYRIHRYRPANSQKY